MRAASSKRVSSWRNAASTVMTRNGMATKRLGHDHAGGGERQRDAEPAVEVLADEAAPSQRVEQRDAGHHRRQHHRQRAERSHQPPARERDPGQQPGERHAEAAARSTVAHNEQMSDRRSAARALSDGEDRPRVAPRRLPQQADERQREERDGDDGQDEHRRAAGAPRRPGGVGRSPDGPAPSWSRRAAKPYFARMA